MSALLPFYLRGAEIWGKRLAILQEALPKLSNFSFLTPQARWELNPIQRALREAANRTGISLRPALLQGRIDETQFRELFSGMRQDQAEALIVGDDATFFTYRRLVTELAAADRIPAIYSNIFFVEAGGLIVYANDLVVLYRHVAAQIDKVLKGANPGDIPYYLATNYKLSINLKTAKSLSLELPATLVARADEVIE